MSQNWSMTNYPKVNKFGFGFSTHSPRDLKSTVLSFRGWLKSEIVKRFLTEFTAGCVSKADYGYIWLSCWLNSHDTAPAGLPGSGKSTFAQQLVKSAGNFERVCQDGRAGVSSRRAKLKQTCGVALVWLMFPVLMLLWLAWLLLVVGCGRWSLVISPAAQDELSGRDAFERAIGPVAKVWAWRTRTNNETLKRWRAIPSNA